MNYTYLLSYTYVYVRIRTYVEHTLMVHMYTATCVWMTLCCRQVHMYICVYVIT